MQHAIEPDGLLRKEFVFSRAAYARISTFRLVSLSGRAVNLFVLNYLFRLGVGGVESTDKIDDTNYFKILRAAQEAEELNFRNGLPAAQASEILEQRRDEASDAS